MPAIPLLKMPVIRQVRRNHALEHATIHVLSSRVRGLRMAGRSDATGFVLVGDVPTESIQRAVDDALSRLRRGERRLAIHPNCGTNLVTTGYLTSLAGLLTTRGASRRDDMVSRLPLVMTSMLAAILISQPIGTWLQRHVTTDGDPADMTIIDITRHQVPWLGGKMVLHRVNTRSS
jgi:hypothetical protein